jgi:hypothetical protein
VALNTLNICCHHRISKQPHINTLIGINVFFFHIDIDRFALWQARFIRPLAHEQFGNPNPAPDISGTSIDDKTSHVQV